MVNDPSMHSPLTVGDQQGHMGNMAYYGQSIAFYRKINPYVVGFISGGLLVGLLLYLFR